MPWCDIGVNLADKRLTQHLEALQAQCVDHSVSHLIAIGCDLASSQKVIELASREALGPVKIACTAGFHPHNASQASDQAKAEIAALVKSDSVVAIGECGLDFNRNFSTPHEQLTAFEWQLQLAVEVNKPVYLHERDAFSDQVAMLNKYASNLKGGVVHCFTGTVDQLKTYLDFGFYIGITGWVCDPNRGNDLRNAIKHLPLDRILLETDSPYLTPKSLKPRPKYNHPGTLPTIADYVAQHISVPVEILQRASFNNAMSFFELGTSQS